MAGNDSDARRRAETAYNDARKAGTTGADLGRLKAAAEAARATELSSTGQNEQAGGIFR